MNKRKGLNVEGKVTVIRQIESGEKIADACWEFSLVNSAIQTIRKNGTKKKFVWAEWIENKEILKA
jgi:hypothetical protein